MDLDQLQSVRDRERQTDRLQQLRDSFYEEAAEFVRELRAERDATAAEAADPFGAPQVNRLTDRIRTAEQTLEAIYEKRVGKVVKAATFAAADLPAEAEGMTREEADLFETLVAEIEENRSEVLGRLSDDGDVGTDVLSATDGAETDAGSESDGRDSLGAADVMGEGPAAGGRDPNPDPAADSGPGDGGPPAGDAEQPPDDGETGSQTDGESGESGTGGGSGDGDVVGSEDGNTDEANSGVGSGASDGDGSGTDAGGDADVDRELVRITDDVGAILGVDEREYDLAEDDVVTLPTENARPLVERGAAERLE